MEKSKLGISLSLFAALLYFIGVLSIEAVVITAGYVLLFEANEKLKRTAVKAVILIVFLTILTLLINTLISLMSSSYSYLYYFILNSSISSYNFSQNLFQASAAAISQVVSIIKVVVPIIFAFRAYKIIDVPIKCIDKILDKHF